MASTSILLSSSKSTFIFSTWVKPLKNQYYLALLKNRPPTEQTIIMVLILIILHTRISKNATNKSQFSFQIFKFIMITKIIAYSAHIQPFFCFSGKNYQTLSVIFKTITANTLAFGYSGNH
jgi:hypothetical protein